MPEMPRAGDDSTETVVAAHDQGCGYYAALQNFLMYSFGWSRIDKGLSWWRDEGWPASDPRFELLRDTWLADGTLDDFATWIATQSPEDLSRPLAPFAMAPDLGQLRKSEVNNDSGYRERWPWNGGGDPFHLGDGGHAGAPSAGAERYPTWFTPRPAKITAVDTESGTALLVADGIEGWYFHLASYGAALPRRPNDSSWRVEVHVKTVGYLGTFRRSRQTGLWFSGRHRFHVVGN